MSGGGNAAHGARQLAEIAAVIARRDGLHGGAQGSLVLGGFGHEPQLRTERRHLRAGGALSRKRVHGSRLRVRQARSGPHAERVIDNQQREPVIEKRRRAAVYKRIGEGGNQQQQRQQPERQQQKIAQAPMPRGALRPKFIQHQRRHGSGGILLPL